MPTPHHQSSNLGLTGTPPPISAMASYPYTCDLEIFFPTASEADIVKRALEVDREIGDGVVKTFSLGPGANTFEEVVLTV